MNIYITNNFNLKMFERGCELKSEEVDINKFTETLMERIRNGFNLKFIISSVKSMETLVNLIGIQVEGGVVTGESIESEEIEIGDVVLVAAPTQSCGFRFFIVTIQFKRL